MECIFFGILTYIGFRSRLPPRATGIEKATLYVGVKRSEREAVARKGAGTRKKTNKLRNHNNSKCSLQRSSRHQPQRPPIPLLSSFGLDPATSRVPKACSCCFIFSSSNVPYFFGSRHAYCWTGWQGFPQSFGIIFCFFPKCFHLPFF